MATRSGEFPQPWKKSIQISSEHEGDLLPFSIFVDAIWKEYRGKLKGHLLDGSYSFTTGKFRGSQIFPCIDMRSSIPGSDWELVENPPTKIEPGVGIAILSRGDFHQVALESLELKMLSNMA